MESEDTVGAPPVQQPPPVAPSPPPVVHALSGSVGAVVAMALLYPLDQVRAILQVNRNKHVSLLTAACNRCIRVYDRYGMTLSYVCMLPVLLLCC